MSAEEISAISHMILEKLRNVKDGEHGLDLPGQIGRANNSRFKRWVADPQVNARPEGMNFGDIHVALDELQARLDEVRLQYPAIPED